MLTFVAAEIELEEGEYAVIHSSVAPNKPFKLSWMPWSESEKNKARKQ
jgi:hypothetical protein